MKIKPPKKNRKGLPPVEEQGNDSLHIPDPAVKKNINFKISPEKYREFRTYASEHDMTMSNLFLKAFELYKKVNG